MTLDGILINIILYKEKYQIFLNNLDKLEGVFGFIRYLEKKG